MRYKKSCKCGECSNSMYVDYFGKFLLPPDSSSDLKNSEKMDLDNVYFSFKTKFTQRNSEGFIDASVQVHPEDLPEYIEKLQKIYQDYQEVKQELKKQGKLEEISEIGKKESLKNLRSKVSPSDNPHKDIDPKFLDDDAVDDLYN